jgi:hypothetical protein
MVDPCLQLSRQGESPWVAHDLAGSQPGEGRPPPSRPGSGFGPHVARSVGQQEYSRSRFWFVGHSLPEEVQLQRLAGVSL